ncbi:MAG: hypothetical protein OEZ02_11780 [Anaerolineae bacterium]|nr:hypothetical protein [Anaerolineae bacterium]
MIKHHSYDRYTREHINIFKFFFLFFSFLFLILFPGVNALIKNDLTLFDADNLPDLGVYISILLPIYFSIVVINSYNEISVLDTGLLIHVYFFLHFRKFVPWGDIIQIQEKMYLSDFVAIVQVKKLTFLHREVSKFVGVGTMTSSIVIFPGLKDNEELIETIQNHIAE